MTAQWTVKDAEGKLLPQFSGASPLEVGRKVVPIHYDAFRLRVSMSYRELFERALMQVLRREDWQIVRAKAKRTRRSQAAKEVSVPAHGARSTLQVAGRSGPQ